MCVCHTVIYRKKDLNSQTHGELIQQKKRENKNGRAVHVGLMFNSTCDRQTACIWFNLRTVYLHLHFTFRFFSSRSVFNEINIGLTQFLIIQVFIKHWSIATITNQS